MPRSTRNISRSRNHEVMGGNKIINYMYKGGLVSIKFARSPSLTPTHQDPRDPTASISRWLCQSLERGGGSGTIDREELFAGAFVKFGEGDFRLFFFVKQYFLAEGLQ